MRGRAFILAITAGGLLAAAAFGASPDWFQLDENEESSFFFDRGGVSASEGALHVRTRVVYSERGRREALKVLSDLADAAPLYETLYSYEINCAEREGHLLAATHLDKTGGMLKSTDLSAVTQWEYLPPDSRMGLVLRQACTR